MANDMRMTAGKSEAKHPPGFYASPDRFTGDDWIQFLTFARCVKKYTFDSRERRDTLQRLKALFFASSGPDRDAIWQSMTPENTLRYLSNRNGQMTKAECEAILEVTNKFRDRGYRI